VVEIALGRLEKIKPSGAKAYFALVGLLLLGFLHPLFAFAAAVLFGFFATGFVLLRVFGIGFESLEFFFITCVSSVVFSALSAYLFFKIGWLGIAAGFAAFSLPLIFLEINAKPGLGNFFAGAKRHSAAMALALFSFAFVFFVLSNSLWVPSQDGMLSNGWNWSDFLLHHSIIKSVLEGNFPPQTPFFAGEPLVYHWFADLHTAILALPGVFSIPQLVVFENSFYALLTSLGAYLLALRLTGSKKAAIIASVLVVFGGGMGYLKFFQDVSAGGNALELAGAHSYDNNWEPGRNFAGVEFKIPSVLGAGLYSWRAMAAGLPILIACALLLFSWRAERDEKAGRRKAGLAGILAGGAVAFHFYLLPAFFLLASGMLAFDAIAGGLRKAQQSAKTLSAVFARALLVGGPFIAMIALRASGGSGMFLNPGWESKAGDAPSFLAFYALNLGIPFLLAIAALFLVAKKELQEKWILALWALALFLVPNIVSFSAIAWDMNKFFSFMWVPLCILAGALLAKAWENGIFGKAVAAALILASAISPLLVSAWFLQGHWVALSWGQMAAADWIEKNTPGDAIFATAATINEPTDLAGRLRILGFPPYSANLGLSSAQRETDLKALYCGTPDDAAEVMEKYGATFVVGDYGRSAQCAHRFAQSALFEKVFQQGGTSIYRYIR
jgi:hypothetical protein